MNIKDFSNGQIVLSCANRVGVPLGGDNVCVQLCFPSLVFFFFFFFYLLINQTLPFYLAPSLFFSIWKSFFFFKFNKPLSAKYIYHVLFCVLIVSTNVLNSSKVKASFWHSSPFFLCFSSDTTVEEEIRFCQVLQHRKRSSRINGLLKPLDSTPFRPHKT